MFNIVGCNVIFISDQSYYEEGTIKEIKIDNDNKEVKLIIKVKTTINNKESIEIHKNVSIGNVLNIYKL